MLLSAGKLLSNVSKCYSLIFGCRTKTRFPLINQGYDQEEWKTKYDRIWDLTELGTMTTNWPMNHKEPGLGPIKRGSFMRPGSRLETHRNKTRNKDNEHDQEPRRTWNENQ